MENFNGNSIRTKEINCIKSVMKSCIIHNENKTLCVSKKVISLLLINDRISHHYRHHLSLQKKSIPSIEIAATKLIFCPLFAGTVPNALNFCVIFHILHNMHIKSCFIMINKFCIIDINSFYCTCLSQ